MSLRVLNQIRKTIVFRLTLGYAGILILSILFLCGLAYFLLSSSLKRQDELSIQSTIQVLSDSYRTGGMEALRLEVETEKKFGKRTPFFIRVAGPERMTLLLVLPYQWIGFDFKALVNGAHHERVVWSRLPLRGRDHELEVMSAPLGGGYLLQVGKSNEDRRKILRDFLNVFLLLMIPLMLSALLGGALAASRALRPIRHLIHTVRAIDAGKMDARVPSPRTGDELEELVTLFNGMLTKIESLINGMKNSLDNVAHDLRTPMTRLRGVAEMALQSDQTVDSLREALGDAMEESERILTMLNTLMDISEAETGVMKLKRVRLNVCRMIEDVVELYRYVAEDKHISLETRVSEDLHVTVDPIRMSQVLGNIVDNAIKYTPSGGRIDIEARLDLDGMVILIKDTGTGISPEELPRIWDRLYRGDQSRSQRGLGLGLSQVKAILRAHGGHIEARSELGKGSIFSITLPE